MRLDKYLAQSTGRSRSQVKEDIKRGAVSINGVVCRKAEGKVLEDDQVALFGKLLSYEEFVYIMLDKPKGVVSAASDANDVTVVDLVRKDFPRRNLFPAGRLDKTSTGFVLVTDDGNFAHDILSPRHHVSKTYKVEVDAPITKAMIDGFENGVVLADETKMHPAKLIVDENNSFCATVVLTQGVYHQIKRMFGVFDVGVNELRRIAIGNLSLDENLGEGGYKLLDSNEVEKIVK